MEGKEDFLYEHVFWPALLGLVELAQLGRVPGPPLRPSAISAPAASAAAPPSKTADSPHAAPHFLSEK